MKLRSLEITGFGKFENLRLQLRDGLNVVYGYNESGKSTLVAFIKSMLFGFKKDNTRTRSYQAEYDKFLPWLARDFGGAIEYELDGNSYRVERIFDRNREEIKVYQLDSGRDITRSFPYDKNRREYVFTDEHLGLHEKAFSGSVLLEQGSFAVNPLDAAPFIKEKLINLMMTGEEEISLKKAFQVIERAEEEIGTPRAQKKPLGEAVTRLNSLQKELASLEEQMKSLNTKETLLTAKREQLAATRDEIEVLQRAHLYLEAAEHFEYYIRTQEKLTALKPEEVARELRTQREAFEQHQAKTEQQRKALEELDKQIKVDNPEFWIQKIDSLNQTVLNLNRESSNLEADAGDSAQRAGDKKKRSAGLLVCSLIVFTVFLVCLYKHLSLLFAGPAFLVSAILGLMAFKNHQAYQELARAGQEVDVRKNVNNLLIMENQNLLNDILAQLGAKDWDQAKRYLQDSVRLRNRKREIQKDIELIQREILSLESKIQRLEERMIEIQNIIVERDRERAILESLGFKDVDKNAQEFFNISKKFYHTGRDDNQEVEREIQKLSTVYEGILLEIGKLEQQLDERPSVLARYEDTQANVVFWQSRLKELTRNLEVLALARKGIEEAVKGYQQDYLNILNQKVGQIVEQLSEGRYHTVNLTEDLEIMTVAPETMKLIGADKTSCGTMELFYLALRLALAELLSEPRQELFVILDEPFANLDTPRIHRFIPYLENLARQQQLIVLTCREEILKLLPSGANVVNLEEIA